MSLSDKLVSDYYSLFSWVFVIFHSFSSIFIDIRHCAASLITIHPYSWLIYYYSLFVHSYSLLFVIIHHLSIIVITVHYLFILFHYICYYLSISVTLHHYLLLFIIVLTVLFCENSRQFNSVYRKMDENNAPDEENAYRFLSRLANILNKLALKRLQLWSTITYYVITISVKNCSKLLNDSDPSPFSWLGVPH